MDMHHDTAHMNHADQEPIVTMSRRRSTPSGQPDDTLRAMARAPASQERQRRERTRNETRNGVSADDTRLIDRIMREHGAVFRALAKR
jgi:hypothetical protein